MDEGTADALAAIDRAVEWLRRRREEGWPPLSEQYLAHIERVERMPQNQPGADKSWVWQAEVRHRQWKTRFRRLR